MHSHRRTVVRLALAVACAVLFGVRPADAAQCTVSTTSVAFGTYNVFTTAPGDSTGTVVYRCNGGARNIRVEISKGASPVFFVRVMLKGSDFLVYNLYRDASRTSIWGDGSSGTSYYFNANPPNNQNVSVPIYGRIPAGQDVRSGSYSDSVVLAVNF